MKHYMSECFADYIHMQHLCAHIMVLFCVTPVVIKILTNLPSQKI